MAISPQRGGATLGGDCGKIDRRLLAGFNREAVVGSTDDPSGEEGLLLGALRFAAGVENKLPGRGERGDYSLKHLIIGTAGHVDHGKSVLIKALTGIDTDRLQEEKRRGISIDLGFASFSLPGGRLAGVVDVPGHQRFIHNMLAGAGGMDLVLLVVDATEGVMPQTREHLQILELLNIHRGIVVITKIDLVETEWLELVKEELREELSGTS